MTTPINVGDDNLAHQITAALDSIREDVWRDHTVQPHWGDRLTDIAGLRAQQRHLAKFIRDFRHKNCAAADLAKIFDDAANDLIRWQRQLEFQRQWIIAASSAHALGQADFARRLARVYRLLYGGDLRYEPVDDPLVFKPSTVFSVARNHERWIWNSSIHYVEWNHNQMQFFDLAYENVSDRQRRIYRALEKRGLLDAPCRNEIGQHLDAAYRAASFKATFYAMDEAWLCSIFAALDAPNLSLASALMRLYAHMFGTVYLIGGLFVDRPPLGSGHVPDNPTEQQAKRCLFECNRLRAAWVNRLEHQEKERAVWERNQASSDAEVL